jgi:hypothetical protein
MIDRLNAPVSVTATFNHRTRQLDIKRVQFDGHEHVIRRVSYHHTQRKGKTLLHIFCVSGEDVFFKIVLNTDTLLWSLHEIHSHAFDNLAIQSEAFDGDAH